MRSPWFLASLLMLACPGPDDAPDAALLDGGPTRDGGVANPGTDAGGTHDAGPVADAAAQDASTNLDAGESMPEDASVDAALDSSVVRDAGTEDAGADAASDAGRGRPLPGFGAISGPCDVLDTELTASTPAFFANHIDFGSDPYDDADYALLSVGGREMIDDGNAGGSSLLSEVFSYELLARCEGAALLKTETEIAYDDPGSKITDLLVDMDGLRIGVSVTRAYAYPPGSGYTTERGRALLEKKLGDILESSANVSAGDAWVKQVLYIMAFNDQHLAAVEEALGAIDGALKSDTVVMVSVSDGDDAFLY
jgi:hypothetical protein